MAVIVKNKKDGRTYIMLGASFSYYKETKPSILGGYIFPNEEEGEYQLAAVCNDEGRIFWIPSRDLRIIEIDGVKVKDVFSNLDKEYQNEVVCPICGERVGRYDRKCHSCGVTLMEEDIF